MDFGESIGLLLFLFFLFLQFISSLFGRKTKGKRPPSPDEAGEAPASGDGGPTTFEEALRQIQEALGEGPRPAEPSTQSADTKGDVDVIAPPPTVRPGASSRVDNRSGEGSFSDDQWVDEEDTLAFQHFDDFEARGQEHFDSGAHAEYEAARERRAAMFDRPLATDRPTLMEREVADDALRGQRTLSQIDAPRSYLQQPASGKATAASTQRLRRLLASDEQVKDAYRLHVILGEPKARQRR